MCSGCPADMSAQNQPFGYVCHRCLRCCNGKHIQVNPYEVASLARALGLSTTEFRKEWTVDAQGTELKRTRANACVFLGPKGCTVHGARPLVCRLYPLGRHVSSDGVERFSQLEPVAQSAGEYLTSGSIERFLAAQGAPPFMQAADDYYFWSCRVLEALHSGAADPDPVRDSATARDWLDMDLAINRYCESIGVPPPDDLESRRRLHMELLEQQFQQNAQAAQ
jgi:Fe-S-cluster containining protein